MAQHPLAAAVGGAPADIIAAASKVTPQLTSLFAHPLLQAMLAKDQDGPMFDVSRSMRVIFFLPDPWLAGIGYIFLGRAG